MKFDPTPYHIWNVENSNGENTCGERSKENFRLKFEFSTDINFENIPRNRILSMRLVESCYRISKVIQFRIVRPELRPFLVPEKERIQANSGLDRFSMNERKTE